jgi:hypothetical protein
MGSGNSFDLDISHLNNGFYLVEILSEGQQIGYYKIIKNSP